MIVLIHLIILHKNKSTNSIGLNQNIDLISLNSIFITNRCHKLFYNFVDILPSYNKKKVINEEVLTLAWNNAAPKYGHFLVQVK